MAANKSGNYGSNRADFGVSNRRKQAQWSGLSLFRITLIQFLTRSQMGVHWYVSRPTPGLLNAGSKGRNTASLPLQLSTSYLSIL
jgi:hypothetical protein